MSLITQGIAMPEFYIFSNEKNTSSINHGFGSTKIGNNYYFYDNDGFNYAPSYEQGLKNYLGKEQGNFQKIDLSILLSDFY